MKKAGLFLAISLIFLVSGVYALASDCNSYYYFDNTNKNCSQKEFCGMYMYQGLQTFESKTQCENTLNPKEDRSCSTESDCMVTSCGYCVNKNEPEPILCEQSPYEFNYTLSCQCTNAQCEVVKTNKSVSIICPQDMKTCPNGLSVSRNPAKNCEFECPGDERIKIMPETASQTAIDRLGDLNFTIELKEVGKGSNAKQVYELTGNKQGKFLGIFKIMVRVQAQVDAETGEVKVIKPWWAFLASGI